MSDACAPPSRRPRPAGSGGDSPAGRAAVLATVLLGGLVGCQTRYARRPEIGTVALYGVGGKLELSARHTRGEELSKVGAEDVRLRESVFRESLRLDTSGYVYHPNLAEFSVAGLFGFIQQDFASNFEEVNPDVRDNGIALEFDASTVFLKEKTYPLTLFARRFRSLEPQAFRPSVDRRTRRYGLEWRYVDTTMPTVVRLERSDVEFDQLGGFESDWREKQDLGRLETGYNFSDRNTLSVTLEHRDVRTEQEGQLADFEYRADEARLTHLLRFGDAAGHVLDSALLDYDQTGTFGVRRREWTENLKLRHSASLDSWYRGELSDRVHKDPAGGPDIDERKVHASGGVHHRLYKSLTSSLSGAFERQNFEAGARVDYLSSTAGVDYRKRAVGGVLLAGVNVNLQRTDQGGAGRPLRILDERHTFNDPRPVILNHPNVILSSLVITNEQQTVVYREGLDYTVVQFASRVEIHRVTTGRIANGQTVLIDYEIAQGAAYQLDLARVRFRLRQELAFGLSPYYRLLWQGERLEATDELAPVPEDIRAHVVGLELTGEALHASAEFEDHDSSLAPYDALRASASYTHRFGGPATARLYTLWSRLDYDPPAARRTTNLDLGSTYRHQVAKALRLEANALYRYENDTLRNVSQGYHLDVSLAWRFRKIEFRLTGDMSRFTTDTNRTTTAMVYVQIIREF